MGRLSLKKIEQIKKEYEKEPNATRVAEILGLDRRTVAKHAEEKSQPESETLQSTSEVQSNREQKSKFSQFLQLKKKGVSNVDIAIKLDIDSPTVEQYNLQWYRLKGMNALEKTYRELSVKGLESVAEHINMIGRENMNIIKFNDKLKMVGNLINLDKESDAVRQQTATGRSELESIENQIKSKMESLQRLDPIGKEQIHEIIVNKTNELFEDPWDIISMIGEAATKVLRDPAKYETMDTYLLARNYSELGYENMEEDYKNTVNEIVAQFNIDFAQRLQVYARQAMQRFNEHFAADNGISQPSSPNAAA